MNVSGFSDIVISGMNDPVCSFWVGQAVGQFHSMSTLWGLLAAFLVFKVVDKLAWTPFLDWTKKKIYGEKK